MPQIVVEKCYLIERLTDILMCGLSAAFFFALVSRKILQRMEGAKSTPPDKAI